MYINNFNKTFYTKHGNTFKILGYCYDNKSDDMIVSYIYNGKKSNKVIKKEHFENFLNNQKKYERYAFIKEHNIKNIYHFTNIDNLESILENGILSKNKLMSGNIYFYETDPYRYDNMLDYINTSISYFNYKMLYSITRNNNRYVLMEINSMPLLSTDTLFSDKNAASNDAIISDDISLLYKGSRKYYDSNNKEHILPISFPTNPSSEALIKDKIDVSNIKGVVYLSNIDSKDKDKVKSLTRNINVPSTWTDNFKPRCDYRRWMND